MIKLLLALLPGIVILQIASAQSRGYIVIARGDSTIYRQAWIDDNAHRENQNFINFRKSSKLPAEPIAKDSIQEFGYEKGRRWTKKAVLVNNNTDTHFLEVIEDGFFQLLFSKRYNKFYLGGNTLTELQHNDRWDQTFQEQLTRLVDNCPNTLFTLPNVSYRKGALRHVLDNANHSRCRPVPFSSWGVVGGAHTGRFRVGPQVLSLESTSNIDIEANGTGYSLGLFLEQPLWRTSGFSITEEIMYNNIEFSDSEILNTLDQDVNIRLDYLLLGAAVKYSLSGKHIRPFAQAGFHYGLIINEESRALLALKNENIIQIEEYNDILDIQNWLFGVQLGAGIQYFYTPKQYVTAQCRLMPLVGSEELRLQNVQFLLNFNF